jgi:protein MpaA
MRLNAMRMAAVGAIVLSGCAHRATGPHDSRPSEPAAPPAETAEIIGRSVKGEPIGMVTFGAGERPVLVLGAIHGDEPTSAVLTRALVAELRQDPELVLGVPVAVIEVMNPDGLTAGTRFNARKIDLNRNFPAKNFSGHVRRGKEAVSEPESKALFDVIERLNPRLIVSVHSMDKPCNNYDGPAKDVAETMAKLNGYPAVPTIGYPTPGSLGSWAGNDRQIPIITLELPRKLKADGVWPANRDAVLAAIAFYR